MRTKRSVVIGSSIISLALLGLFLNYGFDSYVYPKFIDLRHRFQRIEQKLDFLEHSVGITLAKYQEKRGPAAFSPPAGRSPFEAGSWSLVGGQGVNGSWKRDHFYKTRSFAVHRDRLFVGLAGTVEGDALVWAYDGQTWELVGGDGVNGSWSEGKYANVLISDGKDLFAGIGGAMGAEIWKMRQGKWERIGAAVLGNWPAEAYQTAYSLAFFKGDLFVGMAAYSTHNAAIYKFDGTRWMIQDVDIARKCEIAYELWSHDDGYLYAGIGSAPGCGDVYRFDGSKWEQVGGDGLRGSWINENFSIALSFATYQGNLVVSLPRLPTVPGNFTSIWAFDGKGWKPLGIGAVPKIWSEFHNFNFLSTYKDFLLVGAGGGPPGNASVWELYDGKHWRHVAGHGKNGSWGGNASRRMNTSRHNSMEYVYRMVMYRGDLFVGFGSAPGVAQVWRFRPRPAS